MSAAPPPHRELVDLGAWLAAGEPRQREVLLALARALGSDFDVVYGDPDPRAHDPSAPASFELLSLQGGLRLEHGPTGVLFALVPGGTTQMGLSDHELAVFDEPELIDSAHAPDPDDLRALHAHAPFMRGAHGNTVTHTLAPFIMAEAPLTCERLSALGIGDAQAQAEPERVGFVMARALAALPAPLRLPSEAEWERACRAGTRSPFPFGDAPPVSLDDPLHPLGLAALGHFPEATSDPWRRHHEAGIAAPPSDPQRASVLGVARGGAALHLPWRRGAGGWLRLMSAWRATWFRERERVALRPVVSLPFAAPAPEPTPRRPAPQWRPARRTSELIGRLFLPDGGEREAARAELMRVCGGFGRWSGQGAAALPWLIELATQESVPERHRILVMIADLVAGEHAATAATGLDRTLAYVVESASHAPARAQHHALLERLPRLLPLAGDIDARIRAALPLVTTLLPEAEAAVRAPLVAVLARETVPEVRASLLLGRGRLDRFARRAPDRGALSDPSPLVAGAARLAALCADQRALADDVTALAPEHEAALAAFVRAQPDPELFPWHEGRTAPLMARYLTDCVPNGALMAGLLLARLVREAGLGDDPRLVTWAEGAVRIALTGSERRRLEAMTPDHWKIVADLTRRDFPGLAPAWRAAGLPADMGERRTLLVRHRGRL